MILRIEFKIMRQISLALIAAAVIAFAPSAQAAGTYWTTGNLLKDFFATSERVSYEKHKITDSELQSLTARLGYKPAKSEYTIFIAYTGSHVDGYALIDDENGQHQPITFGVQFDTNGAVVRQEVMIYREGYGEEIRDPRFRKQFAGKHVDELKSDVVAVAGATISSHSMSVGVRRAAVIIDELMIKPRRTANAAPASSKG
jgi:hypothetical protein